MAGRVLSNCDGTSLGLVRGDMLLRDLLLRVGTSIQRAVIGLGPDAGVPVVGVALWNLFLMQHYVGDLLSWIILT